MSMPSPTSGEGGARREAVGGRGHAFPTRKALLARARWMRAHPTDAEKRLWGMLRAHRFARFKFKRQQIIDFYIVDFVCLSERLIIEADGSQHADNKDDERRADYLQKQGFRVLRFWNNQVLAETEAVAEPIYSALNNPHPPTARRWAPPSPLQGEGLGAPHA